MMQNQVITITDKHRAAAQLILERVLIERTPKFIMTVTGEVGTGKSTVSYLLAKLLKDLGIRTKIMDLDNYYKTSPLDRKEWRLKHGLDHVGPEEYNWNKIYENIEDFKQSKKATMPLVDLLTDYVDELTTDFSGVDILIIKGLYSIKCKESKIRVFIELSYQDALDQNLYVASETTDDFRLKVMQKEQEMVRLLKKDANFFIDFDNSNEIFHL
jgi:uridine kinase